MHPSDVLHRGNWQRAVIEAVERLPDRIAAGVGWQEPTDATVTLVLSGDPWRSADGSVQVERPLFLLEVGGDWLTAEHATVGEAIAAVQLMVLHRVAAFCPSLGVTKDAAGRFLWPDGRPVLAWQV